MATYSLDYIFPVDPAYVNNYSMAVLYNTSTGSMAATYDLTVAGQDLLFADDLLSVVSLSTTNATLTAEFNSGDQTMHIISSYVWSGVGERPLVLIQGDTASYDLALPDVEQCDVCNEVTLPACQEMYTFTAGLTPDTEYKAVMTSRDGREYIQTVTSDGVGDFSIYMTDAPRGFSTPENSPVQVVVRLSDNGADQGITVDNVEHPCTLVNFVYREDITPIILTLFINNDYGIPLTNDSGEELEYG